MVLMTEGRTHGINEKKSIFMNTCALGYDLILSTCIWFMFPSRWVLLVSIRKSNMSVFHGVLYKALCLPGSLPPEQIWESFLD